MDDNNFPVELQSDFFWFEFDAAPPVKQIVSAFVPYSYTPIKINNKSSHDTAGDANLNNFQNANKRMIEFLRSMSNATNKRDSVSVSVSMGVLEKEKCYRHMMNERMRREKQKQCYSSLHSMMPKGTKNDKNSIVQMAARTIHELKSYVEVLQRKKMELEKNLAAKRLKEKEIGTVIRLNVANPSSGINSMLAVLNSLKSYGVNARAIHTNLSNTHFSAQLAIDTTTHQMGAGELERTLQMTLWEVERKVRGYGNEGQVNAHVAVNKV